MTSPIQVIEPPKDGTPIVASGRIIWSDSFSTSVDAFTSTIRWYTDSSGYTGWHYVRCGCVVGQHGDEVIVDFWIPYTPEP